MAYDERLAERVRGLLQSRRLVEKKMFGGIAFMVRGHMCCGVIGEKLMVRVGPDEYERAIQRAHAAPMDFTGKPMRGFVYVSLAGLRTRAQLKSWIDRGLAFTGTLPAKDV